MKNYKEGQIVWGIGKNDKILELQILELKNNDEVFAFEVKKDYNVYDITRWQTFPDRIKALEYLLKKYGKEIDIATGKYQSIIKKYQSLLIKKDKSK